jgi:beta-lactamase class A
MQKHYKPKRKKRIKKINVNIAIPIALIIFFWFIVIIEIYKPFNSPKTNYPTVVAYEPNNEDSENIFEKLLTTNYQVDEETTLNTKQVEFNKIIKGFKSKKGNYHLYIKDMVLDHTFEHNSAEVLVGASLYKIPTIVGVLKLIENKEIEYDDEFEYTPEDFEGGSGALNQNEYGTKLTIEKLLNELIVNSDNVAQNMLIRNLGYSPFYDAFIKNYKDYKESNFIFDNKVSSKELGILLENILVSNYLNPDSKKYLFDLMSDTSFDDRISDHLDEDVFFSHKIGNWPTTNSWHDCGIVFNNNYEGVYIICYMTDGAIYEEFLSTGKDIAEFVNNTY